MDMKRYWKLITIVLVTIIGIGMHYIQSTNATSNNPQFIIKKMSGNSNEAKNIRVFGEYSIQGRYEDMVHIDETKTVYNNKISFLESLNGVYHTPEIKRLQKDYRSFMRGKEMSTASFYEDETHIAYMTINWDYNEMDYRPSNFAFRVEVLNKQTKDVVVINEPMPNQNTYDYAHVEDVQITNGNLRAVVRQSKRVSDSDQLVEETHIYTFDIRSQIVTEDETIITSYYSQSILSNLEDINPQKYLLIQQANINEVPHREGNTIEETTQKLMIYNYESNELRELPIDKETLNSDNVIIDGSTIYLINFKTNGLEVLPFQIEKGEFSTRKTIKLNIPDEESTPAIQLKNNKLYIVSPLKDKETEAFLVITDLNTWKPLYEGEIEQTNSGKNQVDYTLRFHSLYVE